MNDTQQNWKVARLDEIERRGRDIPVREQLGIHSFGINAFVDRRGWHAVNDHDEAGSGQEELYFVVDGTATFEVDGETIDAPQGTLLYAGGGAAEGGREREPSSLWAARPARCIRRSTGVRRGRSTESRCRPMANSGTPTRPMPSAPRLRACPITRV